MHICTGNGQAGWGRKGQQQKAAAGPSKRQVNTLLTDPNGINDINDPWSLQLYRNYVITAAGHESRVTSHQYM